MRKFICSCFIILVLLLTGCTDTVATELSKERVICYIKSNVTYTEEQSLLTLTDGIYDYVLCLTDVCHENVGTECVLYVEYTRVNGRKEVKNAYAVINSTRHSILLNSSTFAIPASDYR